MWNRIPETEWKGVQHYFSKQALDRGITPREVYWRRIFWGEDGFVLYAMRYREAGRNERWGLRRRDDKDIVASWSQMKELLHSLIGNKTLVEFYPRRQEIVNTAPCRWFWVLEEHPEEMHLGVLSPRELQEKDGQDH